MYERLADCLALTWAIHADSMYLKWVGSSELTGDVAWVHWTHSMCKERLSQSSFSGCIEHTVYLNTICLSDSSVWDGHLLYGKQFSSLNRVFWLVSFWSGFYSTNHYYGNGPFWNFFFRAPAPAPAKFKLRKRKKIKKGKGLELVQNRNERGKHACLEKALFNYFTDFLI